MSRFACASISANAAKKTGKVGWMFWNMEQLIPGSLSPLRCYMICVYCFNVFLLIRNEICHMCLIFCFELVNCWDQSFFSIHVWWITVCSSHPQCFCLSLSIWATKKTLLLSNNSCADLKVNTGKVLRWFGIIVFFTTTWMHICVELSRSGSNTMVALHGCHASPGILSQPFNLNPMCLVNTFLHL